MKKFLKVFSVILAIIVAAGGGVALGYFLPRAIDEFANAEAISCSEYETFQNDGAINTFDDGYVVTKNVSGSTSVMSMTTYVSGKVEALAKGAQADAIANMSFTVKYKINAVVQGVEKEEQYNLNVIVVNTQVSSKDTVMVYFETASGKYSETLEELKRMAQEASDKGLMGMSGDLNLQIPSMIESLNALRKVNVSQINNKEDAVCRRIISGDTTKFEVKEYSSQPEEYKSETKTKLVYNEKQLVEFSQTNKSMSYAEGINDNTNTDFTTVKKGFGGTIKAPADAGEYKKYQPSYANG